ncbi:ABC transporter permease [Paenibacillus glufosinatiresistens]|uniref:ABC transporter permease n=1 Tax=Paenibacillus glufosinatiresistens TaxID=3070657 RepID=UPI00286E8414|nr:ABC transporter permease [Paenibacillus sp. YX.27]
MKTGTARKTAILPSQGTGSPEPVLHAAAPAAAPRKNSEGRPRASASSGRSGALAAGILLPLLAGIAFLAAWQLELFHRLFDLKKYQLPLPSAIVEALRENSSLLATYTGYTLTEAVLGMLAGSALGFVVAIAASGWPRWGGSGLSLAAALNAVPIVALAPILNLWFGDGIGSRVAIVMAATTPAMAINAFKGMSSVDPLALDLMRSCAASRSAVFRHLRIRSSLPHVFTALKINTTASMIAAIVGEFFYSSRGLGYLLSNSIKVAKMPIGWSCIVLAAVAGVLFYLLVEGIERRLIKWHPSRRQAGVSR